MEKIFSGFHSDDIQLLCLHSGRLTLLVAEVISIYQQPPSERLLTGAVHSIRE